MTTIVRGPRPPELEQWLASRRRVGADRFDEVWEGRYVVAPDPHSAHGVLQGQVFALLQPVARGSDWLAAQAFNLGRPDDFRIPDAGLVRGPHRVWHDTAALVVEVLSPEDMTFDKLDFYTAHGVRELLVVDGRARSVRCFALQDGQRERDRSDVLGTTTDQLVEAIEWPPMEDVEE
jgi:Uma2 family endonuclease